MQRERLVLLVRVSTLYLISLNIPLSGISKDQDVRDLTSKRSQRVPSATTNLIACVTWNEIARDLVKEYGQDAAMASRTFALLSIAQRRAALGAAEVLRKPDNGRNRRPNSVADSFLKTAISTASTTILDEIFVDRSRSRRWRHLISLRALREGLVGDNFFAALDVGREQALSVLTERLDDGSQSSAFGTVDQGKYYWATLENRPPVRPRWGSVKPLSIASASDYLPPPPPQVSSQEFEKALAEVRFALEHASSQDRDAIRQWADAIGTSTPTGHWNQIASQMIARFNMTETEASRLLEVLNVAMFDAGVTCWLAKYTYSYPRPSQMDPDIKPLLHVPNFPSYVSGHSTFSSAAAEVLTAFFPSESQHLHEMAQSASNSRILSGLHYQFDCQQGIAVGRAIAIAVLRKEKLIQ